MPQTKAANRWVILTAAAISGLLAGTSYMWSIFQKPLMEYHGWASGQVTLAYSLFFIFVLVGVFVGGPLQQKIKPKFVLLVAGLMQGIGFFLTGYANSIAQLYIFYSLIAGLGNGFIYSAAVSAATKWFPDKKGLANGICIGAMGLAPLLFAPMGNAFISAFGVLGAFRLNGIIMIVAFLIVSWFIEAPEEGWKPDGWEPTVIADTASKKVANVMGHDRTVGQMMATPAYWTMLLMVVCACTSGVMMTGQASVISQEVAHIDAAQGALQVGLLAVCSFAGRLLFGSLSDKMGRFNTYLLLLAITAVDMLFFFGTAHDFVTFLLVMGVTGICFGGVMAMLPSMVSDNYGTRNFSINYPFVYMGYTAASFIGPLLASNSFQSTGSYNQAFVIAGIIAVIGFVLALITKALCLKMHRRDADRA